MNHYLLQSQIPLVEEYDVMVFGGGAAGCMAAVQAGRMKAKTALVEKNGVLGGTMVTAAVNFPGLFHAWTRQVIAGIGWETIEETVRRGGAVLPDFSVQYADREHPRHQVLVNASVFSSVLDDFCLEAGVDIRLHEMPVHIQPDADGCYVILAGKEGLRAVRTRKLVDATGDANVTGLMGYARERGESLQPGTLAFRMEGYRMADIRPEHLLEIYQQARSAGEITITDHIPGEIPFWEELRRGGGGMHIQDIDGSTSKGRTQAELKGRQAVARIYKLLRKVPGCENLQISYAAGECGIRETYRIVGEKKVTADTYTSGYVWPDAICYSFYPIDVHSHQDSTIDIRPLSAGVVPTIPYGALVPQGSDHLLAAGRCISGDQEANSAYRVQASCMATGQGAGAAAAIAAQRGISVREVDVKELKSVLVKYKALIP